MVYLYMYIIYIIYKTFGQAYFAHFYAFANPLFKTFISQTLFFS